MGGMKYGHSGHSVVLADNINVVASAKDTTVVEPVDNQRIINNAVAQQRQRLRAGVQTEGGHFEHLL